ncbi:hypothetical protein TWF694_010509 [Orbilia ellipsospora]|uniref:Uncharacterized protein n=1 Tax=Orbilia ellipsospora TaxID=2528407 RepID=A0AAV9XBD2_9PEZI
MEAKTEPKVEPETNPKSGSDGRHNSAIIDPILMHLVPPIDSTKFSSTYRESQHPYRKYILEEDLFDTLVEPNTGRKFSVQSLVAAEEAAQQQTQTDGSIKPGERTVTSADFEKLLSVARSFAFFASTRLGHHPDEETSLVPHQIVSRHGKGEEDEVIRLRSFIRSTNFEKNYTLENCTKVCRLAIIHLIQTLEGALERYDTDPDILWSLLLHQSVSFAWDSYKSLEILQNSLTTEEKATLGSKWGPQEEESQNVPAHRLLLGAAHRLRGSKTGYIQKFAIIVDIKDLGYQAIGLEA